MQIKSSKFPGNYIRLFGYLRVFRNEQGRKCTYNVTLRRVRVTIVGVEKQ
jgi:hypothetical protein